MWTLTYLYDIGTIYFLYKNVFIRTFIYSEINTFGLPKLSKISFAFNILSLSLRKNGLLGYPKKSLQWTFLCRNPSIKKCIWKNLGGCFSPLSSPGSAYDIPPFGNERTSPIARSFCEGCTWHNLYILVTAVAYFYTVLQYQNKEVVGSLWLCLT